MSQINKYGLRGLCLPVEFASLNGELWLKEEGKSPVRLSEGDFDIIRELAEYIETFYPKAYKALSDEYAKSSLHLSYFRYRIVHRFLCCNFSQLDDIPDIDAHGVCNFEFVNCPIRGECRLDHVVCHPEFETHLTASERRVCVLWADGMSEDDIAGELNLSPYTVHNHIRNAYKRLGIHTRSELVRMISRQRF